MPPRPPLPGDYDCARKKLSPAINLTPHPFLTDVAFMSSKYDPVLTSCFIHSCSDSLKDVYCCVCSWLRLVWLLRVGFLLLRRAGSALWSQRTGFPRCRPWALGAWAQQLRRVGSRLMVCGIFPDQGSNSCPLHLAGGFLTTGPPGKPLTRCFQGSISELIIFSDLFPILWHNERISYILFSCCYTSMDFTLTP